MIEAEHVNDATGSTTLEDSWEVPGRIAEQGYVRLQLESHWELYHDDTFLHHLTILPSISAATTFSLSHTQTASKNPLSPPAFLPRPRSSSY